jgi:FAD/FMN-containing dehydrogenase
MTETVSATTALAELAPSLRGELIGRDSAGYDEARKVHNAMIDKRPLAVARCRDQADVAAAVTFAARHGLDVAVRGAGHSGAGLGTVDDGLVVDLSPMRWVRVDPAKGTALAGGGCQLGDIDHATYAFGLTTPLGIISTTGIGLALGGGIGHLTRKYGLTIDNIVSADVVLADGNIVHASEDENDDLFWALRGGGGNFGVVTSIEFRLHPQANVIAGPIFWPIEAASEVLAWYREWLPAQPDELNGFFAFLTVPPAPPFPEPLQMEKVCGIVFCFAGDPDDADELLRPAREFSTPLMDGTGPAPLPAFQSAFDPLYPAGLQGYWKADFVDTLSDEAIAVHAEFGPKMPTPLSTMHLYPIDGAASRVKSKKTAWAYRDATWAEVIYGVDADPANAGAIRAWASDYWNAIHPYGASGGGAYVNFIQEESDARVRESYGDNFDRLAKVKAKYDPDNVFHVNWNIPPAD